MAQSGLCSLDPEMSAFDPAWTLPCSRNRSSIPPAISHLGDFNRLLALVLIKLSLRTHLHINNVQVKGSRSHGALVLFAGKTTLQEEEHHD